MMKDARLLYVNLTDGTTKVETLDGATYQKYPGGSALGMYILLKEMDPAVDPLSPENIMVFSISPLTGIPISGQSQNECGNQKPLDRAGGRFSSWRHTSRPALAGHGYDAIIFKGKSPKPIYLYLGEGTVELRDATGMWGKTTGDSEEWIAADLGYRKKTEVVPSLDRAEKIKSPTRQSCIEEAGPTAETGVGAVMGYPKT